MKLFKFDSLITPSIVKFLFYLGVIGSGLIAVFIVITGLGMMRTFGIFGSLTGIATIIGGLLAVIIGVVFSRVATELILVVFMIRDELAWQRQQQQSSNGPTPTVE